MTTDQKKTVEKQATPAKAKSVGVANPKESKYYAYELIRNSSLFGVTSEVVKVALAEHGYKKFTQSEARQIINDFNNKEVK